MVYAKQSYVRIDFICADNARQIRESTLQAEFYPRTWLCLRTQHTVEIKMKISMIAATGKNMELGRNNALIWRLPDDLKFFKKTTLGKSVIMGRKTFESLPKALPGRKNIVITSNKNYDAPGAVTVTSPDDALKEAEGDEVFVIGGESVYKAFLPAADRIYLTETDGTCDDADAFFPDFDKKKYKASVLGENENNGIKFVHILYEKRV